MLAVGPWSGTEFGDLRMKPGLHPRKHEQLWALCTEVKNRTLEPDLPRFESWLVHHTDHFLSLGLGFVICKMEVRTPVVESPQDSVCTSPGAP